MHEGTHLLHGGDLVEPAVVCPLGRKAVALQPEAAHSRDGSVPGGRIGLVIGARGAAAPALLSLLRRQRLRRLAPAALAPARPLRRPVVLRDALDVEGGALRHCEDETDS